MDNHTFCRACKKEIATDATICPMCSSYQKFFTRQKIVNSGDLALGLILALFSICTLSATLYTSGINSKRPKLAIEIIPSPKKGVIMIYNYGGKPAVLLESNITVRHNMGADSFMFNTKDFEIVQPGGYLIVETKDDKADAFSKIDYESQFKCNTSVKFMSNEKIRIVDSGEYNCLPPASLASRVFKQEQLVKEKVLR
jgi:hypothetical protein